MSFLIVTTSGVGAIASAAFGCGDECETQGSTTPDGGHGLGCAPFCTDCTCPSSVCPALAESPALIAATSAPIHVVYAEDEPAGSPTLPGVFHPPRRSC